MRTLITSTAIVVALATPMAFADNKDEKTITVTGTVITPLGLTQNTSVTMPHLVAGADATTSVRLRCDSGGMATASWTGGGSPFAAGRGGGAANNVADSDNAGDVGAATSDVTGECGSIAVEGQEDFNYALKVSLETTSDSDSTGITLTKATCTAANGGFTDATTGTSVLTGGTDSLYCGAAVTSAGSNTDVYDQLNFTVAVVYD